MTFWLGVLGSVLGSAVFWSLLIALSRPRFVFSESLARSQHRSTLSVKVRNAMPWSVQRVELQCLLLKGDQSRLRYFPVVARGSGQPLMGGWALSRLRRHRYDILGSSHRIWELDIISGGHGGSSDVLVMEPRDRLIVSLGGIDGMLFSTERWMVRTYLSSDILDGSFQRGRSLGVHPMPSRAEAECSSMHRGFWLRCSLRLRNSF